MIDGYVWGGILAITVATCVARTGLLWLPGKLTWPPAIDAALRYAPACALAGIVAPDLLLTAGTTQLDWQQPKLWAGLAGLAIFATSRSMIATIIGGMAIFTALRLGLFGIFMT